MTWAEELAKPGTEKHPLVILRPRKRLTGWTLDSGNVWVAEFELGPINKLYAKSSDAANWTKVSTTPASDKNWWHDEENGLVYVYLASGGSDGPDDPDLVYDGVYGPTVPGLTVEYDIYLSTAPLYGPRDPLDASSTPVEWLAKLIESPKASYGSRQQLFGFNPIEETALRINNQDGWMMEHLYDQSYANCEIRSYVMAGADLERAAELSYVREVFRGYGGAPLNQDGIVSVPSFDFLSLLEKPATPPQRVSTAEFPAVDPEAVRPGREWFIRRVRGMVDNFKPINIDYNATPSTTVNRDFLTHEGTGTKGTYGATVDDANPGNSGTRTYLTTTPKVNVGDAVVIIKGGTARYTSVTAVNRAGMYFDHAAVAGTFAPGDSIIRYFIGWVKVQDSNGKWWNLFASRNFSRINKGTLGNNPDWLGFRLIDDWEADVGFPETFDPAKHEVLCRVYGSEDLDNYADGSTPVGAVTNNGGVASQSISLLHWLLRQAGIPNAMIDQASFSGAVNADSLGIAIPRAREDHIAPTYRELIRLVLVSQIWKLVYTEVSNELLIGLIETGPFAAAADYDTDAKDFRDFSFEHDYSAIYHRFELGYGTKETTRDGDPDIFNTFTNDANHIVLAENHLARDLHGVEETFEEEILQFIEAEAQAIADRYAFALGDRRAFYQYALGTEFLEGANIGASFQVKREQLPGFEYVDGTERERQTMLIEVTKSAQNVNLTLEDQKGIQDNAGDW